MKPKISILMPSYKRTDTLFEKGELFDYFGNMGFMGAIASICGATVIKKSSFSGLFFDKKFGY